MIKDQDHAYVIDQREKAHIIKIEAGKKFETHHGFIMYDAVIGLLDDAELRQRIAASGRGRALAPRAGHWTFPPGCPS